MMSTQTEEQIRAEYAEMLEEARKGKNYEEDARHAFHLCKTKLEILKRETDPNYKPPKQWYE